MFKLRIGAQKLRTVLRIDSVFNHESPTKRLNLHICRRIFFLAGIVIGVLLLAVIIGGVAYVALRGVPAPVKNVFTDTKEAVDSSVQFQHTNMQDSAFGSSP